MFSDFNLYINDHTPVAFAPLTERTRDAQKVRSKPIY